MGMYTECLLKLSMKPGEKLEKIRDRISGIDNTITGTHRDGMLFLCNSFYHHPDTIASLKGDYLFARFDLKNYDGDIEALLEWMSDSVDEPEGKCIGWFWYEEEDMPSLLVFDGKSINIEHPA